MARDTDIRQRLQALESLCQQRGARLTRQRRAALEALLKAERPLSAYELRDVLHASDAAATAASTYRCLDFLIEHGFAHRLETTKTFVACDYPDHAHAGQFLICRACGTVVETEDRRIARAADELGERHGFALDHRTVELTGVCAACNPAGSE